MIVTKEYLRSHPDEIFVFGDNLYRSGYGGAASIRDEPNTYGFITKYRPSNKTIDFFTVKEYKIIFEDELLELKFEIENNPDKTYLISQIGAGYANRHHIFEEVIEPGIKKELDHYSNVRFLW